MRRCERVELTGIEDQAQPQIALLLVLHPLLVAETIDHPALPVIQTMRSTRFAMCDLSALDMRTRAL